MIRDSVFTMTLPSSSPTSQIGRVLTFRYEGVLFRFPPISLTFVLVASKQEPTAGVVETRSTASSRERAECQLQWFKLVHNGYNGPMEFNFVNRAVCF
jgi:hypothetical protein